MEKISFLEKSNKELLSYKKALEETVEELCNEEDREKRMALANINQIRKRGKTKTEPVISTPLSE